MKLFIIIILHLWLPVFSIAQQNPYWEEWNKEQADSLRLIIYNSTNDTIRMAVARSLGYYYMEIDLDSSHHFLQKQASLAVQLKSKLWEADALDNIGYILSYKKNYAQSLKVFLDAIKIAEDKETEKNIWQVSRFSKAGDPAMARLVVLASCRLDIGRLYGYTGNIKEELANSFEALKIAERVADQANLANINMNIGIIFIRLNQLDSALNFEKKALAYTESSGFYKYNGNLYSYLGTIYLKKGNYPLAKQNFAIAIQESEQQNNRYALALACISLGNTLGFMGDKDSSIWYAKRGLQISNAPDLLANAYTSLSSIYKLRNNMDSAFFYQGLAMTEKENINNLEKLKQFENIGFDEQLKIQELEKQKIKNQNKIRTYSLLAGLAVISIIAFITYRNNRQKQKANKILEKTLTDLKSTQAQLIQSEKMASLGELTAGIAHEIQNPLNFINNFSEVNKELLEELKGQSSKVKGERNEQVETELLNDIEENEEKINHHGRRADAIVKGMLAHSRTGSGQKEPTDINALCDEYLRLAYHAFQAGLKGKDKNFEVSFHFEPDQTLPKINVVPQDIGRVLLNLINNAFQACTERSLGAVNGYGANPMVTVTTLKRDHMVEIRVADNGPGIPDAIRDKIFQPFFTTKPTGQGTGLGLSLSYDIVKAHGGELRVETKEGEGSEFIIHLPV